MIDPHPIHTEEDYEQVLSEIEKLMFADPDLDSPEGERLELLSILVEAYEEKHYPIPAPDDPVEVIQFYMEKNGLTRKDMEAYLGSRARVSEIFNRKRSLSLTMIRRLHSGLGIPADLLIAPITSNQEGSKGRHAFT